ncbi:MAG TPA: helix-turn-helix domain-containing protein [Urbifossiella sp.]|nr:helix-turn-helix domain-containing protein [Urbifossiella sp.]
MATGRKNSSRVAPKIIEGLQGVVDAMRSGGRKELARTHTVRKVARQVQFKPEEIAAIRAEFALTEDELAQFLGISVGEVRDWENDVGTPSGAASRLLDAMRCDPGYWRVRLAANLIA